MRFFLPSALRSLLFQLTLLATALLLTNCSEAPTFLKPGPLFSKAEEVPPLQGQVYIYWPAEEQGRWSNLMVGTCEEVMQWVQPGGYTRVLVPPGRQCFRTEGIWEIESIHTSASAEMDSLDLDIVAGQTLFLRVENVGVYPKMALRSVEPAKAGPEIQRCGEMIPMTEEEMRQAWRARAAG